MILAHAGSWARSRLAGSLLLASGSALALAGPAAAHGDRVPVSKLGSTWLPDAAVLAPAALLLVLFLRAWLRLRRRGRADHASVGRLLTFLAGLALGVLPLVSPLHSIAEEYLLSAHMLEHVLIADTAVALIMLSLRGPLLFFLLPAPVLSPLARFAPLRQFLRTLVRPRIAFGLWCAIIGVWHVPAFYDATLRNQLVHDLEHATFVFAGLVVWYLLIDPARRGELTRSGRLALMAGMFGAGQLLSAVLLFSGSPLYSPYALQDERLLGLSPLTDQRLAGAVMMAEQAIVLGTLAAFMLLAADQEERAASEART